MRVPKVADNSVKITPFVAPFLNTHKEKLVALFVAIPK